MGDDRNDLTKKPCLGGQSPAGGPAVIGRGPERPGTRPKLVVSVEMGDAPFCDVCGHLTKWWEKGKCYLCLHCGNEMGQSAKATPPEPFYLYGAGGERIGVEVTPKSITFFAPANKDEVELESQLNLLSAFIDYVRAAGVIMDYSCETTCLNLSAGDRPDRLTIRISHSSDHDNCTDFC